MDRHPLMIVSNFKAIYAWSSSRNQYRYLLRCAIVFDQATYHMSEAVYEGLHDQWYYAFIQLSDISVTVVSYIRVSRTCFAAVRLLLLSCLPLKRLRGSGKIVKSQHKTHKRLKRASRRINFDRQQQHLNIARTTL